LGLLVAVITGAGQGLGAAAAQLFAKEGSNLVVCDLDEEKLQELVRKVRSEGGSIVSLTGTANKGL